MTNQSDEDAATPVQDLIAAIVSTGKALDDGEAIYRDVKRTVRRIRTALYVGLVGLVLDLVLSIAFGLGLINQIDLNNQIKANQASIKTTDCDLNTLLLSTDTPTNYAAASDKGVYVQQYHVLYQSRTQLGCTPTLTEPVRPAS